MKNYYKILGVKENASEEEIRAHWIELMRKLHPDQERKGAVEDQRVKEINEAYDTLKHSSTRVKYDLKRAYDRRKRRSYTQKLIIRLSLVIFPLIFGFIYLYVRMPQVSSLSKRINENEKSQTSQMKQTNQMDQTNRTESPPVEKTPSPIEKTPPALEPKPSIKIAKVVPEEVNKEDSKEVKKVIPQEMVKVALMTSTSVPGEELRSRERPSTQTILKSEKPVAIEKVAPEEEGKGIPQEVGKILPPISQVIPKDSTTLQSHGSIDSITPKRIDSGDAKGSIDSEAQLTQQRIDPIDAKPQSAQLVQRPEGPSFPILPKPLIATEEEVRQFFNKYIERYTQKDIDGFISLFSSKVIQNQKDGLEGIRKIYKDFFNISQELRYRIEGMRIEIYQNAVEVKARYEVNQILKKREERKVWRGNIRWVLNNEDGALKIISIDYQHQKSP